MLKDPRPAEPAADQPTLVLSAPTVEMDQPGVLAGDSHPPRLAAGIELIGEFADSGFKEPPFIARRTDGQVVQMPQMLYALAEQVDGRSSYEQIAERFSHVVRRQVEASDVELLIDRQLRPLGIVAPQDGADSIELAKVDPLLALKFRAAVVPEGAVRSLTTIFRPLFHSPVVALVVLGLVGVDGWLFFVHGISQSLRHVLYQPALMLMLIGGVVLATAFHEIGHATACRFGGAKPGVMGVGVYIVWPAFYTDITDAYRLGKWGRLRTDVGGMYFNAIFALAVAGLYAATGFEPLLLLIVLQNFAILQQSLPFLRLDGYYILSDLTGVPDIFLRVRPVLASLLPGRPADERVAELKSWVRGVVSVYVVLIVAFLTLSVLAMVINLPRILATGYDSAALHYQAIGPDFQHGHGLRGALDVIQMLFLVLPGAGLLYTAGRIGRRAGTGALRWSAGHPARQTALGLAAAAAVTVAVLSWWPNGEYRPIQPGERGTIEGLISQIRALPTGRASLTALRQQQLAGAPSASGSSSRASSGSTSTTTTSAATTASASSSTTQAAATSTTATTRSMTTSTTPTSTTSTTATSTSPTATDTATTSGSASSTPTNLTPTTP
jgi:putative peptide zinc metalloprotease protein